MGKKIADGAIMEAGVTVEGSIRDLKHLKSINSYNIYIIYKYYSIT
jgi:hypothetical protein